MQNDERCCGTGTCIIDTAGRCWCGLLWDGTQMSRPTNDTAQANATQQLRQHVPGDAAEPADAP